MKRINANIERNKDAFYAYIEKIDGCVAGGKTYKEVKENLIIMLNLAIDADPILKAKYSGAYKIIYQVHLSDFFKLTPEINITQLAKFGDINSTLLRQYASGSKKASEKQALKIMNAINEMAKKLTSIHLIS